MIILKFHDTNGIENDIYGFLHIELTKCGLYNRHMDDDTIPLGRIDLHILSHTGRGSKAVGYMVAVRSTMV